MTAKIKLNAASGGGSVSLQAPSSSSNDRVVSLPDIADGTLLTSESSLSSSKLSGALPAIDGSALTGLGGGIPTGVIVMWSGTVANIPSGYVLCNGSNSTPDLRDRFIVGAKQDDSGTAKTNVSGSLTQTGGAATHTLSEAEMPSHTHHFQITTDSSGPYGSAYAAGNGSGQGWIAGGTKGSSNAHNNLPPYYALCFIMKS
tara:strand:+ start:495 stop:1097 length:603 start_codon:yes stop_codon:yes gene_type:complete